MRMRTINEAFLELKNSDPQTAMTLSGLRRLVSTGKIPSLRIGRRILVNFDGMMEYLNTPPTEHQADSKYGEIRRIGER